MRWPDRSRRPLPQGRALAYRAPASASPLSRGRGQVALTASGVIMPRPPSSFRHARHLQELRRGPGLRPRRSHAPAGDVLGLLGENGAGKTTLMNILFGSLCRRCRQHRRRWPPGRYPRFRRCAGARHRHGASAFPSGAAPYACWKICWSGAPGRGGRLDRAGALSAAGRDRPAFPPDARRPTRWSAISPSASSSASRSSRRCFAAPAC